MNRLSATCALLACLGASSTTFAAARPSAPTALQCDALDHPLGDDSASPLLSWKLDDARVGAAQSAYRVLVASDPHKLSPGHADIWDSGRIASSQSVDVPYGGPALAPETRYYWRVQAWDTRNHAYPLSAVTWWETGLMTEQAWQGQWIGYEDREQQSVREADAQWVTNPAIPTFHDKAASRHDFRFRFDVPGSIRHATLYVTGEDTAAAWIDGSQVLEASQQPPWGRTPWRTYAHRDITSALHSGSNLLAVEITHYQSGGHSRTPMSATLYIEDANGATHVWKTGTPEWKATLSAQGPWHDTSYDDSAWAAAVAFPAPRDAFGGEDSLGDPMPTAAVAALRHSFNVAKPVVSARLYATALGAYEFHLNGKRVGDQVLSPGWTDFRRKAVYQAYDVTSMLQQGNNALGAWLAPGWYSTPLEWVGQGNNYGRTPDALRAQLKLTFSDGTTQWIATDSSWKADRSPITFAEIYDGESYDARLEQAGWDTAGFSDAKWHPVEVIQPSHQPGIAWQSFPPIRASRTVAPKAVTNPRPGVYIYDFGQNLAGVPRLHLAGQPGHTVQLRFGELLNPDGTLYVANLRNAKATDHYTFASQGSADYQPTFTFHGFRYMEVTGVEEQPPLSAVQAVVLHTDAAQTAELKTGSPMINQLWNNILWGQRSNFVGVPTDCPQRDERLGWAADAQVFWRTAAYNMDVTAFSRKYAADLRGTQNSTAMYGIYAPGTTKQNPGYGPGWSDAGVIVPWTSWIQNGDAAIVQQNWDGMQAYLAAILAANPDHLWVKKQGIAFGDWLAPEGTTSEDLLATAYWAYDVSRMQQMAHALGNAQDEEKYAQLFEQIRAAFQKAWVHPGGLVGSQPEKGSAAAPAIVETQTAYVLALAFHLLPDDMRAPAADRLVSRIEANGWKLGTGFLGTPYLLEVLTDTGHADAAYHLLMNTDYPSWGYMVTHGATTMWERWNGDKMIGDPGMNSFNHYAYGAVGEWIYRYAAGVDTTADAPGFHRISLHPVFDRRLGSVDFSYQSRYGAIHSAWTTSSNAIEWKITIPANTSARVALPGTETRAWKINGHAFTSSPLVRNTASHAATTDFDLAAGLYVITLPANPQDSAK
jgi:alpha-L-rhamnosidase